MRGAIFLTEIERIKREQKLPPSVSEQDVEVMYTLLLQARGYITMENLPEVEERLALGAFCWLMWPNKLDNYSGPARTAASHFGGIAKNPALVGKFVARITDEFRHVNAHELFRPGTILNIDTISNILRPVTSNKTRRVARASRMIVAVVGP